MHVQKFGERSPKKFWGQNMQNFGRFYTTSDFDREYLRNGSRYPKSESYDIEIDSFRVLQQQSGELWSTNYWDLDVKPNTHRRRRRDETVLSRRVGVGGVYMNSRRLPTESAMRTHDAAVGRDPVHNIAANGIEVRTVATNLLICPLNFQTKQTPYERCSLTEY